MNQQKMTVSEMAEEVNKMYIGGDTETAISMNEDLHIHVKNNVQNPNCALEQVADSYSEINAWELARNSYSCVIQSMMDNTRHCKPQNDDALTYFLPSASFTVLEKYANVCMQLRDLTGAMRANQKCLAIIRSSTLVADGPNRTSHSARAIVDPRMPSILSNIARIQFVNGSICDAIKVYKYCLSIQRNLIKRDSVAEANTLSVLGRIFRMLGRHRAAIDWHEEALELRTKVMGGSHMSLSSDLLAIAKIHYRLEELDLSLATFSDCLHVLRSNPCSSTGLISSILCNMGIICSLLDDQRNAQGCYEEAITTARPIVDSDPACRPILAKSQYYLATIRQAQGSISMAVECAEEAIQYGLLLEGSGDQLSILRFLLQLYSSCEDREKAQFYSDKIAEIEHKEDDSGQRKKPRGPRSHGAPAA
jgi:tetratricopeptide (TPR) repeat protein